MKLWPQTLEHCLCGVVGSAFAVLFAAGLEVRFGVPFLTTAAIFAVVYFIGLSFVRLAQSIDRLAAAILRFFGL